MADLFQSITAQTPAAQTPAKKFADMGDGTHAEVVAARLTAGVGGGITWGAPTAVAVTAGPTSTTLVAAEPTRKAIIIWNPIGNAQMGVDIDGNVAVLATALPLLAGEKMRLTGDDCPLGAITFIGTAGQSLVYQQGT